MEWVDPCSSARCMGTSTRMGVVATCSSDTSWPNSHRNSEGVSGSLQEIGTNRSRIWLLSRCGELLGRLWWRLMKPSPPFWDLREGDVAWTALLLGLSSRRLWGKCLGTWTPTSMVTAPVSMYLRHSVELRAGVCAQ